MDNMTKLSKQIKAKNCSVLIFDLLETTIKELEDSNENVNPNAKYDDNFLLFKELNELLSSNNDLNIVLYIHKGT